MYKQSLLYLFAAALVGCTSTTPTSAPSSGTPSNSSQPTSAPKITKSPTANDKGDEAGKDTTAATTDNTSAISYRTEKLGDKLAHIFTVKADGKYMVKPIVADQVQTVAQFAKSSQAIAAINGGFFDPKNQQTTSYVVTDKQTVADPKTNERLTKNPNLKIYLRQILDRSEFRRYDCGGKVRYGIQRHSKPAPEGCEVIDALGGGPQLLPDLKSQREAFIDPEMGRDSIGTKNPNARSAIGVTKDNQVLLVMIEQTKPEVGMTIGELAGYMKKLGAETAMNLDGGSSSSIFYQDKATYGSASEREAGGNKAVKSAIVVTPK